MKGILALLLALSLAILAQVPPAVAQDPGREETRLVLSIENKGRVGIRLFADKAPKTVARIVELTNQGFYNGQRFFRVVRSPRPFLAHFGDPNSKSKDLSDPSMGSGGTGRKVPYEDSGASHVYGAVGMSRLPDDKDSGDCQFYIVLGNNNKFLDGSYTVFGQVVEGLELLGRLEQGDRVSTAKIETARRQ